MTFVRRSLIEGRYPDGETARDHLCWNGPHPWWSCDCPPNPPDEDE